MCKCQTAHPYTRFIDAARERVLHLRASHTATPIAAIPQQDTESIAI